MNLLDELKKIRESKLVLDNVWVRLWFNERMPEIKKQLIREVEREPWNEDDYYVNIVIDSVPDKPWELIQREFYSYAQGILGPGFIVEIHKFELGYLADEYRCRISWRLHD